jgi:hypothetical protein
VNNLPPPPEVKGKVSGSPMASLTCWKNGDLIYTIRATSPIFSFTLFTGSFGKIVYNTVQRLAAYFLIMCIIEV